MISLTNTPINHPLVCRLFSGQLNTVVTWYESLEDAFGRPTTKAAKLQFRTELRRLMRVHKYVQQDVWLEQLEDENYNTLAEILFNLDRRVY